MVEDEEEPSIGDMVRIEKAIDCVGFVVDISDVWTPSKTHHAKVYWIAGDYAESNTPLSWVPLNILKCISKR